MTYHMGKKAYVGMALQTNAGTPSSSYNLFIPVTELPSLKGNIEKKWFQEYRNSSAEYNRFAVTKISAEGDIKAPAYPSGGLEHLLYGVFGSMTSTQLSGGSVYQHDFVIDDTPPIFTVGKGYDDQLMEGFSDVIIGSLDISYQAGNEITLSAGCMGRPTGLEATPSSTSYGTERALTFNDVGASLGGSANCDIKSMDIKIDRGVKSLRTMCAAAGLTDNVQYITTTNVSGTIDMFFTDYDEYKYWLGSSTATEPDADASVSTTGRVLEVTATGQSIASSPATEYSNEFTMTLPQIVYDTADISAPWDDRMTIQFAFKGTYDSAESAGAEVISASVKSLLTTVAAP